MGDIHYAQTKRIIQHLSNEVSSGRKGGEGERGRERQKEREREREGGGSTVTIQGQGERYPSSLALVPLPALVSCHHLGTYKTFSRVQVPKGDVIMSTDPNTYTDSLAQTSCLQMCCGQEKSWSNPCEDTPGCLTRSVYSNGAIRDLPTLLRAESEDWHLTGTSNGLGGCHRGITPWSIRNLPSGLTGMLCVCGVGNVSQVISMDHLIHMTLCNAVQALWNCSSS